MTNIQQEINNCFTKPSTKEDLQQIINNLQAWLQISYCNLQIRMEKESSEIALALLKGIGDHYEADNYNALESDKELQDFCLNTAYVISEIMRRISTRSDLKILTLFDLQQIAENQVFAKYNLIDLKTMVDNNGIMQYATDWKCYFNINNTEI